VKKLTRIPFAEAQEAVGGSSSRMAAVIGCTDARISQVRQDGELSENQSLRLAFLYPRKFMRYVRLWRRELKENGK
jgi:hypothetical protein